MRKLKLKVTPEGEICLDLGLATANLVFELKDNGLICVKKEYPDGVPTILSPTGKVWMDRNLGAENPEDYGYYFQWGRNADGHQLPTSEETTAVSTVPTTDNGLWIKPSNDSNHDWLKPQNDKLWKPLNNPCPAGFRLPTFAEFQAEIDAGFIFEMGLPFSGTRGAYGGEPIDVGDYGGYWTSDTMQVHGTYLTITGDYAGKSSYYRASGFPIRAIKDD